MKNSTVVKWMLIVVSVPVLAGCVERRVVYRDRPVPPGSLVVVDAPEPPPPQTEIITVAPGPLAGWFWVPGCWEWRGHWVWAGGHWVGRPHARAVWVRSGWAQHAHGRVWISGHWR